MTILRLFKQKLAEHLENSEEIYISIWIQMYMSSNVNTLYTDIIYLYLNINKYNYILDKFFLTIVYQHEYHKLSMNYFILYKYKTINKKFLQCILLMHLLDK